MKLRSIRIGLGIVGNAVGLLVAKAVIGDDMTLRAGGFVIAVLIFSVLTAVFEPIASRVAARTADALQGVSALVATAVSLWLTEVITSDNFAISGVGAWLLASVIVWLSALILGVILVKLVVSRIADD